MSKEIVRFRVINEFPFQKWKRGEFIFPTQEELEEIQKFKYFFENVTIRYKVIRRKNNTITWVERLSDGKLFKIGDAVSYMTTWNENPETITFVISNFIEKSEEGIVIVCQNKDKSEFHQMVGLGHLQKQ